MEDKEEAKERAKAEKKKKKDPIDPLPYCRNAPSAEHARAELDDEPCDDFREGE
ncbi:MAG: hypothetical protein JRJ03_04675 [Deltaproteobacteria bacterium]|nr:hypothetical protein [Deltaproteobacteria bacterium]